MLFYDDELNDGEITPEPEEEVEDIDDSPADNIVSVVTQFFGTDSESVVPDGSSTWTEKASETLKYIWTRTVTTYDDGVIEYSTPVRDDSEAEKRDTGEEGSPFVPPVVPTEEEVGDVDNGEFIIDIGIPEEDDNYDDAAQSIINYVEAQEEIFNKLTANGQNEGIFYWDNVPVIDPETGEPVIDPETGEPVMRRQLFINASFIRTGILQLGGSNNTFGVLQVLDQNNDVIGQWDKLGISIKDGVIRSQDNTSYWNLSTGELNLKGYVVNTELQNYMIIPNATIQNGNQIVEQSNSLVLTGTTKGDSPTETCNAWVVIANKKYNLSPVSIDVWPYVARDGIPSINRIISICIYQNNLILAWIDEGGKQVAVPYDYTGDHGTPPIMGEDWGDVFEITKPDEPIVLATFVFELLFGGTLSIKDLNVMNPIPLSSVWNSKDLNKQVVSFTSDDETELGEVESERTWIEMDDFVPQGIEEAYEDGRIYSPYELANEASLTMSKAFRLISKAVNNIRYLKHHRVNKTGDTMTGNLDMKNGSNLIVTDPSTEVGVVPSSNYYGKGFFIRDKKEENVGYIRNFYKTDDILGLQMVARRKVGSNILSHTIDLGVDVSGNAKVSLTGTGAAAAWRTALGLRTNIIDNGTGSTTIVSGSGVINNTSSVYKRSGIAVANFVFQLQAGTYTNQQYLLTLNPKPVGTFRFLAGVGTTVHNMRAAADGIFFNNSYTATGTVYVLGQVVYAY